MGDSTYDYDDRGNFEYIKNLDSPVEMSPLDALLKETKVQETILNYLTVSFQFLR